MSKQLVPSHLLVPAGTGSLDAYIQEVNKIPVLTVEFEQQLARQYRDKDDLEAARRMVLAHLRFVVHVAKGYTGYGLALGDLIQEGNIGLMKAVKRFDPDHGVRLVSFAVHWIRAEMHEFILRNWRIVKVATTKAQRKLFFNLRKMSKRLGWFTSAEVKDVAKTLNVTPKESRAYGKFVESLSEQERKLLDSAHHFYLVDVENVGGLVMPVILEVTFEDGSTEILR